MKKMMSPQKGSFSVYVEHILSSVSNWSVRVLYGSFTNSCHWSYLLWWVSSAASCSNWTRSASTTYFFKKHALRRLSTVHSSRFSGIMSYLIASSEQSVFAVECSYALCSLHNTLNQPTVGTMSSCCFFWIPTISAYFVSNFSPNAKSAANRP